MLVDVSLKDNLTYIMYYKNESILNELLFEKLNIGKLCKFYKNVTLNNYI